MTDEQAVKHLKELTRAGALQIITAAHRCSGGINAERRGARGTLPQTAEEQSQCAAHPVPPTHPAHFVCHQVVELTGPDTRGYYSAHSKEGDVCMGLPQPLLRRLLQAPLAIASEKGFASGKEISGELVAWLLRNPAGV